MGNLALITPNMLWEPWQKVARWTATHGRKYRGPSAVSVWQKPGAVQIDFHNATGTWGTWLDLTPDEALRLAGNLLSAARKATAAVVED